MNNRNKQLRSEVVHSRTETARQAVDAIARKFGGDQRDEIQTIVARIHKELRRIEDVANGCDMDMPTIEQRAGHSAKWVAFATSLGVSLFWLSVGVLLAYN